MKSFSSLGLFFGLFLALAHGDKTVETSTRQRQGQPSCPHTEFSCEADQSKRFDTYLQIHVDANDNNAIIMSQMMQQTPQNKPAQKIIESVYRTTLNPN